jgi:DNA-binding response OmpR family regulator
MTPRAFDEIHKILLIQGDGQDAQSVRDALANSSDRAFRVEWVKSCALGLERLAAQPLHDRDGPNAISAILVDLMLPDLAGLGSVDRLVTAAPQIPIIVLCSMQDELVAKEAIQRGAQDYLLKEHLNNYLLPKTLAAVIERASITEALFDRMPWTFRVRGRGRASRRSMVTTCSN